jgi:CheY-like chemotaxis protein
MVPDVSPKPARRVLVVEDDESIRDLLVIMLENENCKGRGASSAREALQLAAAEPYDLIITDLMMPDMGGYEFLRTLQAGDQRTIPVIVLTGKHLDPKAQADLRREPNVADYLSKPLQPAKFSAAVQRALTGQRPAR